MLGDDDVHLHLFWVSWIQELYPYMIYPNL